MRFQCSRRSKQIEKRMMAETAYSLSSFVLRVSRSWEFSSPPTSIGEFGSRLEVNLREVRTNYENSWSDHRRCLFIGRAYRRWDRPVSGKTAAGDGSPGWSTQTISTGSDIQFCRIGDALWRHHGKGSAVLGNYYYRLCSDPR